MPPAGDGQAQVTSPLPDDDLLDDDRGSVVDTGSVSDGSAPSPAAGSATAGSQAPSVAPAGAPQQAQPFSIRQHAQAMGMDVSQYQDDQSFAQALFAGQSAAMQRLQALESERQRLLAGYQQQVQPAAQPQNDPLAAYKSPEWDPRWEYMVERDKSGNLVMKQGADPLAYQKFLQAQQWRQNFSENLFKDPVAFLSPLIDHRAKTIAQELVQTQFQQHQEQQRVNDFMRANDEWLFARDQAGNKIVNPMTRAPVLTQEAIRFHGYLQQAAQMRIPVEAQESYARNMLRADLAAMGVTQPAQQAGQLQKQQVINNLNRRQPNQSGSTVQGDQTGHAGAQQNASLSLSDRYRAAFAANNINDAAIAIEEN